MAWEGSEEDKLAGAGLPGLDWEGTSPGSEAILTLPTWRNGSTPAPAPAPDPLCLADESFSSYAFNLLRVPEELEQMSSQDWHRGADTADRACVSSSTAASTTPIAQRVGSGEFPYGSAAQANSSRILIENQGYAPFGSPPASLISRGGHTRLYAGPSPRAAAAALLASSHSAPAMANKRASDCLEEACKRVRATPELSQHSSMSDSFTVEDFAGRLEAGAQRHSSGELLNSPTACSTQGHQRPDALSAATTPVLEIWQQSSAQAAAGSQNRPQPTATLRPFSIVKTAEGLMTVAQLNSRIQGDAPSAPVSGGVPAPPDASGPSQQGDGQGGEGARELKPAIRISGNTSLSASGITIKQMIRTAWKI